MNAENLPGYRKKSFSLYYNGGEIWFEHLDALFENEGVVLEKLERDIPNFTRPSGTSYIAFVFDETLVTDSIIDAVCSVLCERNKLFRKVAFCGVERKIKNKFSKTLKNSRFDFEFFEGLEDAKEWLLP